MTFVSTNIRDFPHSFYNYTYICLAIKALKIGDTLLVTHFYSGRFDKQCLKIEFTTVKMFWNEKTAFSAHKREHIYHEKRNCSLGVNKIFHRRRYSPLKKEFSSMNDTKMGQQKKKNVFENISSILFVVFICFQHLHGGENVTKKWR